MGIKRIINKMGSNAASSLSKLAVLSPEELEKLEDSRSNYFSKIPNLNDSSAAELTERLLSATSIEIYNAFLSQLKDLYLPLDNKLEYEGLPFDSERNIRFINITKWVIDKSEDSLEKLVNVYAVLSNEEVNVSLIFHRTSRTTNVFLAVTNVKNANHNTEVEKIYKTRLTEALKGNFPGSEWTDINGIGRLNILNDNRPYSVVTASNIPTEKSEKFLTQTIEKLIDGIIPSSKKEEYILILMATPINDIADRKLRLAEMYSSLAPYASWQTNFTFNDSNSFGSSATVGVNVGASAGIQNSANIAQTETQGETKTTSDTDSHTDGEADTKTHTDGESNTDTSSESESKSIGGGIGVGVQNFIQINANGSLTFTQSNSKSKTRSISDSLGITKNVSKTISKTLGKAISTSNSIAKGIAKGTTLGVNFGANFARASNVMATVGYGEGITQNFTNYNIQHTLDLLQNQMNRYELSTALGMWDFAAYVLSEDYNIANNVAHSYIALTQGQESFMSDSAINLWRGDMGEQSAEAREICSYLRDLRQPIFGLNPELIASDESFNAYPTTVTATTPLSGKELSYSLNFPQKSIPGLPVIECAEFGRNISSYNLDDTIVPLRLGNIFHMNHEEKTPVILSKDSLSSHVFITGSTGTGKSNTVYQLINETRQNDVKFLVIEPSKGEYKNIFGNDEDVLVYGTNPFLTTLLKLNPFSFEKEIHVLEHMDRLIEVFNVAWPMYAAMPAILKNAVEKSYKDCGWDLVTSENRIRSDLFPSFTDVTENIKQIVDSSEYDNENKGAYKGALFTRLESLTNGINGMIFSNEEIPSHTLFDSNVIIDLSRVGSTETKSLIMGILVLKLQEYRMASSKTMNSSLKHITILEEAHNLLKRTSTEQSTETSNLLGKSVEMLANAIAEMRTYGEGFIIADQAPNLLDMSVIRNTNTKIIMRLPDLSDRELVGHSANLNDNQIKELAKLPKGVAAIYQNEWIQPVLCKVKKYDSESLYEFNQAHFEQTSSINKEIVEWLMDDVLLMKENCSHLTNLKEKIIKSNLKSTIKTYFLEHFSDKDDEKMYEYIRVLTYDIFDIDTLIKNIDYDINVQYFVTHLVNIITPSIKDYSEDQINLILSLIIEEMAIRDSNYTYIKKEFDNEYNMNGRVF
ncbi:MAG: ATP-binding protein [Streptococcus sp.]|nr:ATP-binding protein [Streptococcus sp.]